MDLLQKLDILADAAKYDVACTSSGVQRSGQKGKLGHASMAGCCHSFTPDGRCVTLLKVLMTNLCAYDCAYCVNRASNEAVERACFTPRELADLTIGFYRRNYIEGLFLSSGVLRDADTTTELMAQTLDILRNEYGFRGYIHAKALPGAAPELIDRLGTLADRLSVNLELPSSRSLRLLAPEKDRQSIIEPMRHIQRSMAEDADTRVLMGRGMVYMGRSKPVRKTRAYAPAGQSTQMIVGATPESDYEILGLAASLYRSIALKRVFFSAYLPVNDDVRLPAIDAVQLDREHRLYQADWLMRFYGFSVEEIIDEQAPFLDTQMDPKAAWALRHLDQFPVEVNEAPLEVLMRVPGIGPRGARLIVRARRQSTLHEADLKKLGVAYKRARYFVTCNGSYGGKGIDFTPESLRAQLAAPIQGGRHGRRSTRQCPGQMSLFDSVDTPEKLRARGQAKHLAGDAGSRVDAGAEADALVKAAVGSDRSKRACSQSQQARQLRPPAKPAKDALPEELFAR